MEVKLRALNEALAANIGNKLSPELAYGILQAVVLAEEDLSLDPANFPPHQVNGYTLSLERLRDNRDVAYDLHMKYWGESGAKEIFDPDYDKLMQLEQIGMYVYFTARYCGEVVGQLGGYLQEDLHTRELIVRDNSLYVLPEHRKGVGKALMKYAIEVMFSIGVRAIQSSTAPDNRNQAVIRRMGFQHVGNQYELRN